MNNNNRNSIFDDNGGILPHGFTRGEMEDINAFIAGATISQVISDAGLTQDQFAEKYEIPLGTVQDWCSGRIVPPPYVIKMIKALLHSKENGGMEK